MTLQSQEPSRLLPPEKGKGGAGVKLITTEETSVAKPPLPIRNEQGRENGNKEKSSARGKNKTRPSRLVKTCPSLSLSLPPRRGGEEEEEEEEEEEGEKANLISQ